MEKAKTIFRQNGEMYQPGTSANQHDELPIGTYVVRHSDIIGFFLTRIPDYTRPRKVYGDLDGMTTRFVNTALDRKSNTGVLLVGEKGSGKTLAGKLMSIKAREAGMPTIIVQTPFHGTEFNEFMGQITQPCLIFFDEFEKVYNYEAQKHLLTLFDGTVSSSKLFILTANSRDLDYHFTNRPGRIYYVADFSVLEEDVLMEFANDHLVNKTHIPELVEISKFIKFNFDMLAAYIQEMNRYDEAPSKALKYMNFKLPEEQIYDIEVILPEKMEAADYVRPTSISRHPLRMDDSDKINIILTWFSKDEDKNDKDETIQLSTRDLEKSNPAEGEYIFVKNGYTVVFKKRERKRDYSMSAHPYFEYLL